MSLPQETSLTTSLKTQIAGHHAKLQGGLERPVTFIEWREFVEHEHLIAAVMEIPRMNS